MDLSVVTTMYCSAPYLREFYARTSAVVKRITNDYEIIFVNDGSPDNSLEISLSLYEQDAKVKIVDLSRNFGHHKAMMTGLAHAKGKLIFLLDSDLEEEPELLEKFYAEMTSSGADVVYGVQQKRKGKIFEQVTGYLFYALFNLLSSYRVPPNAITVRLMSRQYVVNLVRHRDQEIFMPGLCVITGFKQVPMLVQKGCKGRSTYDLARKLSLLVNSITSFSNKPLILIFYLGCVISLLSGVAAFDLIIQRLVFGVFLEGWPSLIVSIWLLGGLIILCLGIIGIYLSKIFMETKPRPYTIIRASYERPGRDSGTEKGAES